MIVTHIDGRSEMLTDYKSLRRKRKVNGEYTLSFLLLETDVNKHSFPIATEESIVDYDGEQYRIKVVAEKTIGKTPVRQIQAFHVFFDLVDEYKYDTIKNTQSLKSCVEFALSGTPFTFSIVDNFDTMVFEAFGNDTSLSLIQSALNSFGAEIEIRKRHLTFKRKIGIDSDAQFRYNYNVKTIEKNIDTSNLSTYIRGFGKQNDDGTYVVTAEYTSPKEHLYPRRKHAPPVYDGRYTEYDSLHERIVRELQDEPELSIRLSVVELKKSGINVDQVGLGDKVFVIYEPLNLDVNARVVEIVEFPEEPTSNEVTIANIQSSFIDEIADFEKTKDRVDGIFDGKEKLPYNVLPDAIKRATESLQSAETELVFENGIIAIDPNNPNNLVLFNSNGIGISRDGGKTFSEAITAAGFVLSAGAIGELNANNINISGVVGAINDDDSLKLMASSIDLYGQVNFSMFDSSTKKKINDKTDSSDVDEIINKTTIDGGKVTITNNTDFINAKNRGDSAYELTSDWKYGFTTEIDGGNIRTGTISAGKITVGADTKFETGYNPKTANDNANAAKNTVDVWKYPGTTLIDGGDIYTNTITVNKLKAGVLTGFTIQTDSNVNNPRVELQKDQVIISNKDKIIAMKAESAGEPVMYFIDGDVADSAEMWHRTNKLRITAEFLDLNVFSEFDVTADITYFNGDVSVSGTKNAAVPTSLGMVNVSAYETAEYYFGDIGRGKVVDGECVVEMESLFLETVNTDVDYEVFLTPYGKGLIYVDEMNADNFIIKGDDIPFAYEIKAKRKGYETVRLEFSNEIGDVVSEDQDVKGS